MTPTRAPWSQTRRLAQKASSAASTAVPEQQRLNHASPATPTSTLHLHNLHWWRARRSETRKTASLARVLLLGLWTWSLIRPLTLGGLERPSRPDFDGRLPVRKIRGGGIGRR